MGYGDLLMAIGAASRQHAADPQRRKVAIGDGRRIDNPAPELSYGLDFLADDQTLASGEPVSWVISHRAFRPHHDHAAMERRWRAEHPWRSRLFGAPDPRALIDRLGYYVFDERHVAVPAPLVLTPEEAALGERLRAEPFVLVEPHIKAAASASKRWPFERFAEVVAALRREIAVHQIGHPDSELLPGVSRVPTGSFRSALPYMKAARLYIGSEGGLHHAAAAMGTPAVVIFGGYIPPAVTGYPTHANLTGDAEACGMHHRPCAHCAEAMDRITPALVLRHARALLSQPREGLDP